MIAFTRLQLDSLRHPGFDRPAARWSTLAHRRGGNVRARTVINVDGSQPSPRAKLSLGIPRDVLAIMEAGALQYEQFKTNGAGTDSGGRIS